MRILTRPRAVVVPPNETFRNNNARFEPLVANFTLYGDGVSFL